MHTLMGLAATACIASHWGWVTLKGRGGLNKCREFISQNNFIRIFISHKIYYLQKLPVKRPLNTNHLVQLQRKPMAFFTCLRASWWHYRKREALQGLMGSTPKKRGLEAQESGLYCVLKNTLLFIHFVWLLGTECTSPLLRERQIVHAQRDIIIQILVCSCRFKEQHV